MPNVELIYDADCPNVESAREQLRQAFQDVGRPVEWSEWDRADPHSPAHVRRFGSPTILVDGQDVAGVAPSDGAPCCRVYRDDGGKFRGVPSVKSIAVSLTGGKRAGSRSWLASVPAALVAVLPNRLLARVCRTAERPRPAVRELHAPADAADDGGPRDRRGDAGRPGEKPPRLRAVHRGVRRRGGDRRRPVRRRMGRHHVCRHRAVDLRLTVEFLAAADVEQDDLSRLRDSRSPDVSTVERSKARKVRTRTLFDLRLLTFDLPTFRERTSP